MSKSVDLILSAVKSAGEAALRLHEENERLRGIIEEQRLSIVALNTVIGGEGSLTTDNLRRHAAQPFPHPGHVTADEMNKPFGPADGSGDWSRATVQPDAAPPHACAHAECPEPHWCKEEGKCLAHKWP